MVTYVDHGPALRHPPGSIPSYYAPERDQQELALVSARASAARSDRAQLVHHHARGQACAGSCELVAPDGTTVRLPADAQAQPPEQLAPEFLAFLEANRRQGWGS